MTADETCPTGWLRFEGKCFGHPKDTLLSWSEAESHCQILSPGAHLASIHSKGELQFVQEHFKHLAQSVWLGGSDFDQEGTWVWSDKTCWDYINWRSKQPDNMGSIENCLMGNLNDLKWDDVNCKEKKLFLCMKLSITFYLR